ncbi:hypothetical protein SUGI_0002270 [Cryptomeria japonica]|uniref:cyclin-D1-1 n=1 Tax=Cryptomeria japonica TaxID=3369 RepID=UPI002408AA14|nr:cyclin-D1-1 [Cryptomeria japonica]GLJ04737.1 hypothetical protein SUGI_0002270 [Cryptomeria japonica]
MVSVSSESLFCEEEIGEFSPSKDDAGLGSAFEASQEVIDFSSPVVEDDGIVRVLLAKEASFMPGDDYCCRLQSAGLRGTRCRAVRWMLKASGHFNFSPHTVSSAVNCLDRFLARSLDKPWKAWMTDLLAVGCLSVAAKQDEVHVPLLQDLQVEGVEYTFNSTTLQRMEVTILNRLEWRLRSVTAFSYTDAVLPYLNIPPILKTFLRARVTELLLQTLSESQFVEYRPSIIALSSIYCALEELLPTQANLLKSNLCNIIAVDKQKLERCYEIMEEVVVDPPCVSSNSKSSPASPIAVAEIAGPIGQDYINSFLIYINKCGITEQRVCISCCENKRKRTN